jgi:hypothetical protein
MTWFISTNRSALLRAPRGVSWWLPARLGGLGLPVTRDVDISAKQLKYAAYIYTHGFLGTKDTRSFFLSQKPGLMRSVAEEVAERRRPLQLRRVPKTPVESPDEPLSWYVPHRGLLAPESDLKPKELVELDIRPRDPQHLYDQLWRRSQATSLRPLSLEKALKSDLPSMMDEPVHRC